jgi:large subunit ribosomal protein L11
MATQTVEALVDGGKASAAPPLGPALGPLGINIGQVIAEINKKTEVFKGMQVPIKVIVDQSNKSFTITVGTPPASALIRKEANIEKGSSNPLQDKVADLRIEQIIKIAKMKEDAIHGKTMRECVKVIMGTCNSMGILVEGKPAVDAIHDVNNGAFAQEIASEKTELTAEELKELEQEKKRLAEEIEKRRESLLAAANKIIAEMAGQERGKIKAKLVAAGIPTKMIEELLPVEPAPGAAPAAGAAAGTATVGKESPAKGKEEKK